MQSRPDCITCLVSSVGAQMNWLPGTRYLALIDLFHLWRPASCSCLFKVPTFNYSRCGKPLQRYHIVWIIDLQRDTPFLPKCNISELPFLLLLQIPFRCLLKPQECYCFLVVYLSIWVVNLYPSELLFEQREKTFISLVNLRCNHMARNRTGQAYLSTLLVTKQNRSSCVWQIHKRLH